MESPEKWVPDHQTLFVYPVLSTMKAFLHCGSGLNDAGEKITRSSQESPLGLTDQCSTPGVAVSTKKKHRHIISHNVSERDLSALSPSSELTDPCVNVWIDW